MKDPRSFLQIPLVALASMILSVAAAEEWLEDSFEDFIDGKVDASGHNLYVSRDGTVRTIHRFDVNQDGFLDLMFNNTHDSRRFVNATLASSTPNRAAENQPLAVDGSVQSVFADLNRDGYQDIVFCPNSSGVQNGRRFLTTIYGGSDGWPTRRSNGLLPVNNATAIAIVDLNADEWPDIVALNGEAWLRGQPTPGRILRLFWGGDDGFILNNTSEIGVVNAVDISAADFDGDGANDLAVLTESGAVRIFWSGSSSSLDPYDEFPLPEADTPTFIAAANIDDDDHVDIVVTSAAAKLHILYGNGRRQFSKPDTVKSVDATHLTAADLDADGRTDLVLTNFIQNRAGGGETSGALKTAGAAVHILWGDSNFELSKASRMDIAYAAAADVVDFDGDGHLDLTVAVHQSEVAYQVESPIYFGQSTKEFTRSDIAVTTFGARHVSALAASDQGPAQLVFSNSLDGAVGEFVSSQIFWGSQRGFDADNQLKIPMRSGYESSAADLDADGFVDLVALNTGHAGKISETDPNVGANIFWGGEQGFDLEGRRSVVPERRRASSNVADLDRDGYLDLVLGSFHAESPITVHYGSEDGFKPAGRREIKGSEGRMAEPMIADFNNDEWLDIVAPGFATDDVRIFAGGADGFTGELLAKLSLPAAVALDVADCNSDGYLDIVVSSYRDPVSNRRDTGLMIFWGDAAGFQTWNAQWLPGTAPISPTVADFDGDGYLDIFSANYHAELTREDLPSYVFWGGADGFSAQRRTSLICDSAHDAQAGDFDRDGQLDIAVSCHASNGDHNTMSRVFYNDGERFAAPETVELSTHGTHWMWSQDMGHVHDRGWQQQYESSVFEWTEQRTRGRLSYEADMPIGTALRFEIRSAPSLVSLEYTDWRALGRRRFEVFHDDRVLQYRAIFISDNGDRFPSLEQVHVAIQ